MSAPEPPDWLTDPPARAAFVNGYRACVGRGIWDDSCRSGLGVLAQSAAIYVGLVRRAAELRPEKVGDDLRTEISEYRRVVREYMVEFLLLDRLNVAGGDLRADGLDADIARLCDVPTLQ